MGLSLVTGPATEPITLTEAKAHLRISGSDEDSLIEDEYIPAARTYIEGVTRRGLIAQTWDYTLEEFPIGELELPMQPVTAVSWVHYVDTTGATVSYADTSTSPETPYWTLITDRPRATIIPNYNLNWPATRSHGNAVTVRFVVGYSTLPADIKQAMYLLVAHMHETREPVSFGTTTGEIDLTVKAMMSGYILREF